MKLKKGISVFDQCDKLGFGVVNLVKFRTETLKKPIHDLEILFNKLKKDKILSEEICTENWIGSQQDL